MEYYKDTNLEPISYVNKDGLSCLEIFKDIPGYEGCYQVSNLGRVKSLEGFKKNGSKMQRRPEIILKQNFDTHGYLKITLSVNAIKKHKKIHLLVVMAFHNHFSDGTYKVVVDHIDNNPTNNMSNNFQFISNRMNSNKDKKNRLGFAGVFVSHKKFSCSIYLNKRNNNLGSYETPKEAYDVRQEALSLIESGQCIEHLVKRQNKKATY